jgi:hypothetical protein
MNDPGKPKAKGHAMPDNPLTARGRLHLERLKLAADVLLTERDDIPDTLEAENHPLPRPRRARSPVSGGLAIPAVY